MKKFTITLLALLLSILLVACGGEATDENNTSTENSQEEAINDNTNQTDENQENEEKEEEQQPEENDTTGGDVIENEAGVFTAHKKMEEPQTYESGPIILTIDKIVTASGDLTGDMAEFMETDHLEYIQVDISVENTSNKDITFYAAQGTMATSTGEQLEADMFLSDHIEGDMMAGTKGSGSVFYILENSKAEEVDSVRLKFSAPYDTESYDDVGENIDFTIDIP